jgi:3-oxoacyl-(acyl-carrier-protein) synthase
LLATEFGARGPCNNFVQGETASAQALASGYFDLLEGRCDMVLAGGYDCLLTPSIYLAYHRAGLLSAGEPADVHGPFDERRDGVALGEGAAFVVMERREHAQRRGARVIAELAGVGLGQMQDGAGARADVMTTLQRAIAEADAAFVPDVIVARGIGTHDGDREEAALLADLGYDQVPVTAFKALTGYLGAAPAVAELCIALLAAARGTVPPIAKLETPDADCQLDLVATVPRALPTAEASVLALSGSWCGQVAAIAARAHPARPEES